MTALDRLGRELRAFQYGMRKIARAWSRRDYTPGERHIDRMCREVAGKPDAALRLFVAAGCVAPVLDGAR